MRDQTLFKTLKTLLNNGFRVCTVSNATNDVLMAGFSFRDGPELGLELLASWCLGALEGALIVNSDSKFKK